MCVVRELEVLSSLGVPERGERVEQREQCIDGGVTDVCESSPLCEPSLSKGHDHRTRNPAPPCSIVGSGIPASQHTSRICSCRRPPVWTKPAQKV